MMILILDSCMFVPKFSISLFFIFVNLFRYKKIDRFLYFLMILKPIQISSFKSVSL